MPDPIGTLQWKSPPPRRVSSQPCRNDNGSCIQAFYFRERDGMTQILFRDGSSYIYSRIPDETWLLMATDWANAACVFNHNVRWNPDVIYLGPVPRILDDMELLWQRV